MQAEKFGAEIIFPAAVSELVCLGPAGPYRLEFAGGGAVTARTVVIASGARYRRPAIADIERYEGRGVWYWASPLEARLCAGTEVALVGGGNSAGQAAVYLSGHAARVNLLIRGPDINRNMSRYLVERIEATPNVEVRTETEITALDGRPGAAPRGPDLGVPAQRRGGDAADPEPVPLRRGRPGDVLGEALQAQARPLGVRADRDGGARCGSRQAAARGEPARRVRDRRRAVRDR